MRNNYLLTIRGKKDTWGLIQKLTPEEAVNLSNDGIEIALMIYSVPSWVASLGLTKPWCFCTDIFNFRNPWRKEE